MLDCPKCGRKNIDDAAFCTKCGIALKPSVASSVERQAKMFAQDMEQRGKNLGESMTHTATRIEQRLDLTSKHIERWYEKTFGIFGPLIESFLFLIILRFAIVIARISKVDVLEMNEITSVILLYLLPLFGATLISNYTTYFAKKSYKFRIFSPLLHSMAFVIFIWIVAQILHALQNRLNIEDLGTAAMNIENMLPTIFVFVLLIGYVVLAMNMSREQGKKP